MRKIEHLVCRRYENTKHQLLKTKTNKINMKGYKVFLSMLIKDYFKRMTSFQIEHTNENMKKKYFLLSCFRSPYMYLRFFR